MNETIFITGATAGFGKAIAEKFAQHQYRIIITGRRGDRLKTFAKQLQDQYNVEVLPLNFDVRNRDEVMNSISSMLDNWKQINILVNNAGLAAGFDFIQDGSFDDWDQMIDTNVKGLLYVTRSIVPFMISAQKGMIINIGSTASLYTYEKGNVYCATKAAVAALSEAMRIDLLTHNIKVTAIHPGAARTEFATVRLKGDEEKVNAVYKGFQPLAAEDIADTVFYCATLPSHVCINELTITPTAQANPFYVNRQK